MSSVISFENKADNSSNLILPGPREQIIIQSRMLKEQENSKLNKQEKEKTKSNRLKAKEKRKNDVVTALAEATIDEARKLGVGRLIEKFDDQTLTVLQREGITRLVHESTKSPLYFVFNKLFLRGPFCVFRNLLLYSMLSIAASLLGALPISIIFVILSNLHIIRAGANDFLNPALFLLIGQCILVPLSIVVLSKYLEHQKRIGKKIQRLLKRKPDFLVSAITLRSRIHSIQNPPIHE